jgi:hypothetical protein
VTFRGEIESLPQDMADLLAAERRAPRPSAMREATIFARIESAVGVTAAVATGFVAGSSGSSAAAGAGQSLSLSSRVITGGRAAGAGATTTGATTAAALSLPASKALIAAMALAVGGAGLGTTAYLATRANAPGTEAARRSATAVRAAGTAPAPSESPPPLPAGLMTTSGVVVVPVAPPASALALPALVNNPTAAVGAGRAASTTWIGGGDTDMGAESALLEDARRALARGRVETALDDVERHARSFPGGHLVEEREVLWVKALVLAGKRDVAQRRAVDFRKRFPHSIQSDALTRALRTKK